MIIVSQYLDGNEVNQIVCNSPEEAAKQIADGNKRAASRWHWGLSRANYFHNDGTSFTIEEENQLRRSCGQEEI